MIEEYITYFKNNEKNEKEVVRKQTYGKARSRSQDAFFTKPMRKPLTLDQAEQGDKMKADMKRGVIGAEGNAPSPAHALTNQSAGKPQRRLRAARTNTKTT